MYKKIKFWYFFINLLMKNGFMKQGILMQYIIFFIEDFIDGVEGGDIEIYR